MKAVKSYSAKEIIALINDIKDIFELVRLVDPENTSVLFVHENGDVDSRPGECFEIWGKDCRCKNCISICAELEKKRKSKLEFTKDNDAFLVVSCPIELRLHEKIRPAVMELAVSAEDSLLLQYGENEPLQVKLSDAYDRIYGDVLTSAYNRRYLDEFNFLYRSAARFRREVALLVLDIKNFKHFNDTYGHAAGDEVLRQVTNRLQENVRTEDSVIRMGGDEFVLTLMGYTEEQGLQKAALLKKEIGRLSPDCVGGEHIEVDIGCAYTPHMETSDSYLLQLLQQADRKMYYSKNCEK